MVRCGGSTAGAVYPSISPPHCVRGRRFNRPQGRKSPPAPSGLAIALNIDQYLPSSLTLFFRVRFLDFQSKDVFFSVQETAIIGVGCGYFFVFCSESPGPHYSFRWSKFTSLFNEFAFIFLGSEITENLLLLTFLAPGRPDVFQEFLTFFSADGAGPIISYYFRMSSITKSLLFYD